MSLQRRRELARLTKPELIDLVVSLEFARMPDADAGRALGLYLAGRQVAPDTEIATVPEVE